MKVTIYKCFIASPGDTAQERDVIKNIIAEINRTIGKRLDFRVETLTWEDNTRPALGDYSQQVISSQLGDDYDLFIGMMHNKFGTPTQNAGSGTEEEFNNAFELAKSGKNVEIMFYFNDAPLERKNMDLLQLEKVESFREKIAALGAYYWSYNGVNDFSKKIREHIFNFFLEKHNETSAEINNVDTLKSALHIKFKERFEKSLKIFSSQPLIWIDPILSTTNEISQNPDENFNKRIDPTELINCTSYTIIKAPEQFGLTSLANFLVKEAWKLDKLWIYLDSDKTKQHTIHNAVKNEVEELGLEIQDIKCIVLDSYDSNDSSSIKKLRSLLECYPDIPIVVMQTIADAQFFEDKDFESLGIKFSILHLLALPRNQVRKVVREYNKAREIAEEEVLLTKVVNDLDNLNIHRTPLNCITLLKVSEKHFDESPVNRTNMLEMVLFILFNVDAIPTYKTKPDLKDCEFVLGCFCENLIRNENYEFSREYFLKQLSTYCEEKLIYLDVDIVFDVLINNNILTFNGLNYSFRASYWVLYFAAKRMHNNTEFAEFIFSSKKYIAFPEIIEFYTGIDRNRSDALSIMSKDLKEVTNIVASKVRLPEGMNPLTQIKWKPTDEQIEKVQEEIGIDVINSGLPNELKDQYADKTYDQRRPYNQTIQTFFEEYSLHNLLQNIKASSRALRNSDYVEPSLKKELLTDIVRSWEQLSKVLFAVAPLVAAKGHLNLEGVSFYITNDFGATYEDRIIRIIQANPTTIVGLFRDDIFSPKISPLLYNHFRNESNESTRHQLALLLIFTRPKEWKKIIEEYIVSLPKNSFYLYNTVNALRSKYRFDVLSDIEVREIGYLIKMGLAKHQFGDKKPGLDKIIKVPNHVLPKREVDTEM